MEKTTDYNIFKFRQDNRAKIIDAHVDLLVNSIRNKNLLHFKPIVVNEKMEIMDGQHRLLAAQRLGVPIYYVVERNMTVFDMIQLQTQRHWRIGDYVQAFAKNGYEHYQKLLEFSKKNDLNIATVVGLIKGRSAQIYESIKCGKFEFDPKSTAQELEYCHDILSVIIREKGNAVFSKSTRFWKALTNLCKHPHYNHEKMMKNLNQMVAKIGPRVDYDGYMTMFLNIHNFRNGLRIDLNDEVKEEE